ncbi:adenine phosphoribosyl transferase [Fadolivirus algeromassiliense]|jgi:adenine phosphoribosyltransferase|uniref:adenine phosphoribosyltransferase n=1 Tax=Fadolivirus FV1/VV64 TaxID=3070911 RepID=A0A7D3V945_9VIRU|nr:adenine phosphoribosyl transferase [Fadolivirus algeromassiliense]QKF94577.1 adenine phosphoribosyl transferase [Fadolivirus FV1/VV64]
MAPTILVTSASKLKLQAVQEVFTEILKTDVNVKGINCYECKLPEQPIVDTLNNGFYCAKERLNFARTKESFDNYDFVISIESVVDTSFSNIEDKACVLIYSKGVLAHGESFGINFDAKYYEQLQKEYKVVEYNNKIYGYDCTVGKLMQNENPEIDHRNWMKIICGVDRIEQIKNGIKRSFKKLAKYNDIRKQLNDTYVAYQDYPKEGVLFYDIFPLFNDPKILKLLIKFIANYYRYDNITHIVGLESRGFCLGVPIALKLNVGFVPVRKVGKLPGKLIKSTYTKEYGSDSCEMQTTLDKDARVLIIDDLIATGGSMKAAIDLVNQLGCTIVDCCVLKNVPGLKEVCDNTVKRSYSVLIQ